MENLSGNIEINTILTLSENKAVCNLFTIQGIKILFDCGWDDNFSDEIANIYRE